MATMTKEEASKAISSLISEAQAKITEAELLSDEHELGFSWDLSYGMGGWYESGEWQASSQSC